MNDKPLYEPHRKSVVFETFAERSEAYRPTKFLKVCKFTIHKNCSKQADYVTKYSILKRDLLMV